ncbi:MAG: hypothetical protein AB7S72_02645 [Draconibacterium sp.]
MSEFPDVYLFNPSCDFAIANGSPNWQPNKTLQKMEADLAVLPMLFAKRSDFVLVDELPDNNYLETMRHLGFVIPRFILKKELSENRFFFDETKNRLLPWGWSPAAHKFLTPLKQSCSPGFQNSPVFQWIQEHRNISSRKFAYEILNKVINSFSVNWLIEDSQLPIICKTPSDIEKAIADWGNLILKAPWSSSGRGLQPITKTPIHPKVWEKINSVISEQGFIMAEPMLNKVHDMAFLFELKNGCTRFLGVSHFFTNNKGQYGGNWLNGLPQNQSPKLTDFIQKCIEVLTQPLMNAIDNSLMAKHYEGVFGIDTLIYRNANNELRINPCLEINVRHTMGMISLRLEKWLGAEITGTYRIFYQPGTSFATFKKIMEQKHPVKLSDGKFQSGFLALTPSNESVQFGAYLLV